jgi:hypothetical protein
MEQAGIDDGVARKKDGKLGRNVSRLSFHSLRHSFNSAMANADVPLEIRQNKALFSELVCDFRSESWNEIELTKLSLRYPIQLQEFRQRYYLIHARCFLFQTSVYRI